jgi:hypothetical protein
MEYDVLVMEDDQLRDDWMLVEHQEGMTLVMRRGAMTSPRVAAEAWAAFRMLTEPRVPIPRASSLLPLAV